MLPGDLPTRGCTPASDTTTLLRTLGGDSFPGSSTCPSARRAGPCPACKNVNAPLASVNTLTLNSNAGLFFQFSSRQRL